ncbi:hypothetical protein NC653_031082 [Populus alba x Populus x berolinensis]|uniref:Uncharacterized protein n=1 Tax=Populus alba x Populus x berolinensis TaxID=444605 RepID=A0AAD6Q139_9ROSI|nr:hypothetical protein NC653_031082 [Populus alba x Populus x berolinensis]
MASCYFDDKSRLNSFLTLFFLLLLLFINPSSVLSKSPRPITDVEVRQIKNECYADIESGLWGQQCKTSMTAKENCALKCLSPICYELIYESDPLEEGEKDFTRSQEYKYCMYKCSYDFPHIDSHEASAPEILEKIHVNTCVRVTRHYLHLLQSFNWCCQNIFQVTSVMDNPTTTPV